MVVFKVLWLFIMVLSTMATAGLLVHVLTMSEGFATLSAVIAFGISIFCLSEIDVS